MRTRHRTADRTDDEELEPVTVPPIRSAGAVLTAVLLVPGCSATAPPTSRPTTSSPGTTPATTSTSPAAGPAVAFGRLETEFDARLGVHAVDTGTGR